MWSVVSSSNFCACDECFFFSVGWMAFSLLPLLFCFEWMSTLSAVAVAVAKMMFHTPAPLRLWVSSFLLNVSASSFFQFGSSRFVGLEPCRFSPKSKDYISKAKSLQASGFGTADVNESLIKGQVSTASLVACLRVWCRLPDEWTSLMMPRSKRQPHLEVLFVVGQVVWMRSGWPGSGQNSIFSEGS